MTRQVWRYALQPDGIVGGEGWPKGAKIVHVGLHVFGDPQVWVEVDPGAERVRPPIRVVPTGREIPDGHVHRGSFVLPDGLVFHVYEGVSQ